jgi:hypothetical protein
MLIANCCSRVESAPETSRVLSVFQALDNVQHSHQPSITHVYHNI